MQAESGEFARRLLVAEVEPLQPGLEGLTAFGDFVELVFHLRRELVVDQIREVELQEIHHGEGAKRRHQGLALLPDVAAPVDRLHDRRVRRGATDAEVFELLDQCRLGVAIGRLGLVQLGLGPLDGDLAAFAQGRQEALLVGQFGLGIVGALHVGPAKARELNAQPRGAQGHRHVTGEVHDVTHSPRESHLVLSESRVDHLRGDGALPDEVVDR